MKIRWVILSLIDVDKWWAYVNDLIRDLICLLCYVSIVIAWCVWNGGQYSCDVNILGGMSVYFLNNCIIRVFYRFNRSMALQMASLHMSLWLRGAFVPLPPFLFFVGCRRFQYIDESYGGGATFSWLWCRPWWGGAAHPPSVCGWHTHNRWKELEECAIYARSAFVVWGNFEAEGEF